MSTIMKILTHIPKLFFKTSLRYYPAPVKRFYKNVHILENEGNYEIILDKRKLKTPLGNLFQIPNEALAVAIATEWDLQKSTIQQHNMHLTALCNTALDNPCRNSKEAIVEQTLQFLSSDTLCFRSKEPPEFFILQKEEWDPVLNWFQDRYDIPIEPCEDISSSPVSDTALQNMKKHLLSYNEWCMLGIHFSTENLKSLILSLAVVNHVIDVESAVHLSRLETDFQVKQWGKVEWSHCIDEAQVRARVAAAALFTYLNEGRTFDAENSMKKVSKLGIR